MDKKLEARIRRLERIMKNEGAKASVDIKGTLDNMLKEYSDIAEAVESLANENDKVGEKLSNEIYKMGQTIRFCLQLIKKLK